MIAIGGLEAPALPLRDAISDEGLHLGTRLTMQLTMPLWRVAIACKKRVAATRHDGCGDVDLRPAVVGGVRTVRHALSLRPRQAPTDSRGRRLFGSAHAGDREFPAHPIRMQGANGLSFDLRLVANGGVDAIPTIDWSMIMMRPIEMVDYLRATACTDKPAESSGLIEPGTLVSFSG